MGSSISWSSELKSLISEDELKKAKAILIKEHEKGIADKIEEIVKSKGKDIIKIQELT
jgi:ribosome recycling factor